MCQNTISNTTSKDSQAFLDPEKKSNRINVDEENPEQRVSWANGAIEDVPVTETAFGNPETAEVKFITMHWWQVGVHMIAETISLGVLSLPHVLKTLGLFWGLFCILSFGMLATYNGYVYGQFFRANKAIASVADAANVVGGRYAKEFVGACSTIVLIFIMAAHISTFSMAMNVLTDHGTCTTVFAIVGVILSILCTIPRKLSNMAWFSVASCISIGAAVFITMIGIAVSDKPADLHIEVFATPGFLDAMTAILNLILAYAGHVAYFSFIAELKRPEDFTKSLVMTQSFTTFFYIMTSVVIYCFAGDHVMAPALGSAPPLIEKIAYGVAMPTIIIAGVINGHVAVKYVWLRIWEHNRNEVTKNSFKAIGSWIGIVVLIWIAAWLIAEGIPSFQLLLALVSALFMGWFSYGFSGIFWWNINWSSWRSSKRKICLAVLNSTIIVIGALICIIGLYATAKNLANGAGGSSFSCGDNSTPDAQGH
ncbi:amino acid transporter [Rhizodiscina lignyota]|uniref:Amino acid transporter n=1 Tax=Rhizodiscina lignyota TaxID=1504668 RepID=A0A9P4M7N0_9PEZI|nr:amino acid transporter [Rhizodiscina lignyota]